MLNYCLIKDGVVVNRIALVEGSDWAPPEGFILGPEEGNIGDTWDGTTYHTPEVPAPTVTQADYEKAIDAHVDAMAKNRGYKSAESLATYINSTIASWATEAQTFIQWRDQVWAYCYIQLGKVKNNERPQPTVEGFIAELPAITWPGAS